VHQATLRERAKSSAKVKKRSGPDGIATTAEIGGRLSSDKGEKDGTM
jgi:hypothetical protein